ncbi:MAG TPA: phosphotransferase, partial [Chloroflexota bacterium]|nr:phosphotransferase [Chloroflexota bacterium]
ARGDDETGEWMVLRRLEATTWTRAWPSLNAHDRRRLVGALARALVALHATQPPTAFQNPWLRAALAGSSLLHEAHHPPVEALPALFERLRASRCADPGLLHTLQQRAVELRDACSPSDPRVLVHADMHWDNLLVRNGELVAILDWEGARVGRAEQELDTILRYTAWPWLGAAPDDLALCRTADYGPIPEWLKAAEPALFELPGLPERLELYAIAHDLLQALHFARSDPPPEGTVWWRLGKLADGTYPLPPAVFD